MPRLLRPSEDFNAQDVITSAEQDGDAIGLIVMLHRIGPGRVTARASMPPSMTGPVLRQLADFIRSIADDLDDVQ